MVADRTVDACAEGARTATGMASARGGRVIWIREEVEAATRRLPRRGKSNRRDVEDSDPWARMKAA
jgi:hypothetical protein